MERFYFIKIILLLSEDLETKETEDDEVRGEIKEEVHELQDYESEEKRTLVQKNSVIIRLECKYLD
jgi:hypothetical protein